jgi:hypothetical protein
VRKPRLRPPSMVVVSTTLIASAWMMVAPAGLAAATVNTCRGRWSVQRTPDQTYENYLSGVAAISTTDVWAVGTTNGNYDTLTEHFNGQRWKVVASPNVPGEDRLIAVAAVSPVDIWAVGAADSGRTPQPLAEHWNGSRWRIMKTPSLGSYSPLAGVAAVSTDDVWAVGGYFNGRNHALIEHWDGAEWSVVPPVDARDGFLADVAAVSTDDVWAVGSYFPVNNQERTLIEHWDGKAWSIVPSPNGSGRDNRLNGVSTDGPGDAWAVGSAQTRGGRLRTLTLHWDGSAWKVVASPNTDVRNQLDGVAAISPIQAWAVGSVEDDTTRTLIERWDGTSWTISRSHDPDPSIDVLLSVSALPSGQAWAVGFASFEHTLVERYC